MNLRDDSLWNLPPINTSATSCAPPPLWLLWSHPEITNYTYVGILYLCEETLMLTYADLWSLIKALCLGQNIVTRVCLMLSIQLIVWILKIALNSFCYNTGQHHTGAKQAGRSHVSICITKPSGFLDCDCKDYSLSLSSCVTYQTFLPNHTHFLTRPHIANLRRTLTTYNMLATGLTD